MKKKEFIHYMAIIQKYYEDHRKMEKGLEKAFGKDTSIIIEINHQIIDNYVKLIGHCMSNNEKTRECIVDNIMWFMFETDFGKGKFIICDENNEYVISDAGKLYDALKYFYIDSLK